MCILRLENCPSGISPVVRRAKAPMAMRLIRLLAFAVR
jgi:hypothetical protein